MRSSSSSTAELSACAAVAFLRVVFFVFFAVLRAVFFVAFLRTVFLAVFFVAFLRAVFFTAFFAVFFAAGAAAPLDPLPAPPSEDACAASSTLLLPEASLATTYALSPFRSLSTATTSPRSCV